MKQKVQKNFMPPTQASDVKRTWADTKKLENRVDYKPATPLKVGIQNFVEWFKDSIVKGKKNYSQICTYLNPYCLLT